MTISKLSRCRIRNNAQLHTVPTINPNCSVGHIAIILFLNVVFSHGVRAFWDVCFNSLHGVTVLGSVVAHIMIQFVIKTYLAGARHVSQQS